MSPATSNPLLTAWDTPYGLPPFAAIEPAHFRPAFDRALAEQLAEIDAIAASPEAPSFDNTVAAFDRSGRLLARLEGLFYNLVASETSPALQAVQTDLAPLMAAHANAVSMHAGLFARVDALHARRDTLGLTPEQRRLLERIHLDMVRAGARLSPEAQQRYRPVMERLAELTTRFAQNVLADESAYRLVLRDEADMAGLPGFVRAAARQAAAERGLDDAGVITLSRSHIVPFLTFSDRRDLREQAWRAWVGRGENEGPTDNRPVAREILTLRHEQARLHGHASYADYALADTMAGTREAVTGLLEKVWGPAKAAAAQEREALEALLLSRGERLEIEPWDWRYVAEKVRQVRYDLDEAQVKPYFPLDRMVEAAFDCAKRLFGLRFVVQPDVKAYHPDVQVHEVRGADDALIGVFLHDNFARPTKRSGAWMSAYRMQSRNPGPGGADDAAVLPVIVNNNNFAKGAPGQPTLLSFDDARTLFHEFGHGLHGLLSNVTYERLSGTNVLRDFVELPSTITIGFSAQGLNPVTSSEINVVAVPDPSVPTTLVITTQPSAANVAGVAFAEQPVIQVNDQYDNIYTSTAGLMVTAARVAGNGDLQGTTTIEAVQGIASFSGLSHNVANDITIGFSATGLVSAVSQTITISPAAADRLAFETQPGSATAGTPFGVQPVVVTQDAFGNASTVGLPLSLPLNVSLLSGTGTLTGVTTDDLGTDDGNGVAVFSDLQINLIGDKQLLATATDFLSATSVVFTVTDLNQTITFAELSDKTFGDAPFEVTATASSGLPVQFSVFSGPATISNNLVTITGAGSVTIRASQPGNGTFAAAPDVDQIFNVSKANQTVTFAELEDKTFGDLPFAVSATASSGLDVTFVIASGPATITNGTITITGAGAVTVTASQAGNDNYNSALDVNQSFDVNKANQTISFGELDDKSVNDGPFEVSATATSGLPVSFSIVSGPATITNGTITITGAGEVIVSASQAGNENFNEATPVNQSFDVNKLTQTITFDEPADRTFGDGSFELIATSTSQLPVSFVVLSGPGTISNNTFIITGAGDVVVRASQAGNELYAAATPVDREFTVGKANQTITFEELSDKTYGTPAFELTAVATSGLEVTFSILSGPATISNNMLTITGIGEITVLASQAGDGNYNAAPGVERSFTVNPIVKFDFNGDQKTDILFQHERYIGIWYMDGTNFLSSALLRNAGAGTANWRVFGMADFTGDNKLDIAFQHFDGRLAIWEMDGDTKVKATIMNNGVPIGVDWRAVSTADVNADNNSDVVFQNKDGRVAVWYMDGLIKASSALIRGTDALGWRVRAAADLNGDFLPDILVQNLDGRISIWDGANFSTTIPLNNGNPVKWTACGMGDFDGDNQTDLLFRSVDNRLAVWIMDGVVRSSAFVLRDGRVVDPKWKVVGPR